MSDSVTEIRGHISRLEQAAQQARVEALRLLGQILIKQNTEAAGAKSNTSHPAELAALQTRYAMLERKIKDLEVKIDTLHAEEHEQKYGR